MNSLNLELIVSRIQDSNPEIQFSALKSLHDFISASNGSVNTAQQELFDIRPSLEKIVLQLTGDNQKYLYDLLSVLNLFQNDQSVLKYRLLGSFTSIESWGLQYVRKLVCCILDVIYQKLEIEDYSPLVEPIGEFLFRHNSEVEAIDFLLEVSFIPLKTESNAEKNRSFANDYTNLILKFMDTDNKDRIIMYLKEMEAFYSIENLMLQVYNDDPSRYLVYLLKLNLKSTAVEYVASITDKELQKQLMHILARCSIYFEAGNNTSKNILSNSFLSENLFKVASSLELLPPQKIDNLFKSTEKEKIEAIAIANGLTHFAYCRDPVFAPQEKDYRLKNEHLELLRAHTTPTIKSSVGLVNSYSHEKILETYANEIYQTPDIGAVLALAIAAHRHHDLDKDVLNSLYPFLSSTKKTDIIAALTGISILYSSSCSQEAYDAIFPLLSSSDQEIILYAIYVLGAIFACSGDEGLVSSCFEVYNQIKIDSSYSNLAILGISLIYMKCPKLYKSPVFESMDKYIKLLSASLMNVGSGSPSIVDGILTEAFTGDTDALLESLGLIASCIVGVGDDVATYLLDRICNSSLLLDSPHLKSVFPLCIALLYPSSPKAEAIDAIEKTLCSGDADSNCLFALGIMGAGTKSSRILRILDANLANVYKDARASSSLIISQGLVNLGKGLFTLCPVFYEKSLVCDRSIIGLVSSLMLYLDQSILGECSFLHYILTNAISPKYVVGFDGTCRVGKPVDTVGLAGKPNKISGAVIHSLPVILNTNERAELEDTVYTSYIEDVLIKKN